VEQWTAILRGVALGEHTRDCIANAGVDYTTFRRYLRRDRRLAQRWHEQLEWRGHRSWPSPLVTNEILNEIVRTPLLSAAQACRKRGIAPRLFYLRANSAPWRERYLRAKNVAHMHGMQAIETEAESLIAGGSARRPLRRFLNRSFNRLAGLKPHLKKHIRRTTKKGPTS